MSWEKLGDKPRDEDAPDEQEPDIGVREPRRPRKPSGSASEEISPEDLDWENAVVLPANDPNVL